MPSRVVEPARRIPDPSRRWRTLGATPWRSPPRYWYGSNLADWGGADGELYAYAARNAVVLLRPLSPDARHAGALVGHTNRVTALCFARGPGAAHLLISGSADKNLRLWDTTARRCLRVLRGHAAEVSAVSASPLASDLFVSGDRSGKVCVWRLGASGGGGAGERPARVLTPLDGTPVLALAMSPAAVNDVAVGHQSGALAVADADGATPRRLPSRAAEVQQLAWLPPPEDDPQRTYDGDDSDGVRTGDPAVLAVGGRERAVTLWTWDGSRTSLRATLALPARPRTRPSHTAVDSGSRSRGADQVPTVPTVPTVMTWRGWSPPVTRERSFDGPFAWATSAAHARARPGCPRARRRRRRVAP